MDTVPPTPAFASETDALHMLDSVLGYLAAADPTRVPTQIQARCLTAFERADARLTAARASYLSAFTAAQGYREDDEDFPADQPVGQRLGDNFVLLGRHARTLVDQQTCLPRAGGMRGDRQVLAPATRADAV